MADALKRVTKALQRVTVLRTWTEADGTYIAHIRINNEESPEYKYYFRGLSDKLHWKIENDKIYSYPQLRELEQASYMYEKVGRDDMKPTDEQMLQNLEKVREIKKGLE
jgi:hypothetical protein